jgi:hypothetical protein
LAILKECIVTQAGGQHAQFLGVLLVVGSAVFYAGSRVNRWSEEADKIRTEMDKEVSVPRAQLARAEAILMHGYAEKYKRYQERALGIKQDSQ